METKPTIWRELAGAYLEGHRWDAVVMTLNYIAKHSIMWVFPLITGLMIDLIGMPLSEAAPKLWWYGGILAFVLAIHVPTTVMYVNRASKIGRETGRRLRLGVCRQLQQLSLLYHERVGPGRLQSKLIRDIGFIELFPRQFANSAMNAATVLLGMAVVVAFKAPLALLIFAVMLPMAAGVRGFFKHRLKKRAKVFRESVEQMSGNLWDMIKMVPVTRAHGLEREAMQTARDHIDAAQQRGMDYDVMTGWFNAAGFLGFSFFRALFLILTVILGILQYFTPGEVVMFNGYFAMATGSFLQFINVLPQYTQTLEGYESVHEVLEAPDLEYNAKKRKVEIIEGRFDFEGVSYRYPGADEPAVAGLDLDIRPNETVAIVGPSGGGKSTTLGLLLGFLRPQEGIVRYDGIPGSDLDLRSYRRHISVVTQQSFLFSGSIRENVAYGNPEITDEQIAHALKLAQAWDFVNELPDGLDTRLGEDGIQLSGGQTQRLAIARAMIRDPRVLVLDEPTSSLDIESEIAVIRAIENAKRDRTTIIVSHSLSMIRGADRIVIVEDGHVVDMGTHEELMRKDNFYSRSSRKLAG